MVKGIAPPISKLTPLLYLPPAAHFRKYNIAIPLPTSLSPISATTISTHKHHLRPHSYLPPLTYPSPYSSSLSLIPPILSTPIHIAHSQLQPLHNKEWRSKHLLEKSSPGLGSSSLPKTNGSCKNFWNPKITKSLIDVCYVAL